MASTASTKEISGKGYTYVITRRIIQRKDSTVLRVRVRAFKGLAYKGDIPAMNDYRDYTSVAQGDQKFAALITQVEKHLGR